MDEGTGEMLLEAKEVFTVSFDSDGGSEVTTQAVISGQMAVKPEAPDRPGYTFAGWYPVEDGDMADVAFDFEQTAIEADITLKAAWEPIPFGLPGTPVFTLPKGIKTIKADAFEGISAEVVWIPDGCTAIGDHAFTDCKELKQIRIPDSVTTIGEDIFEGCNMVVVYGAAGSCAETYCGEGDNNCAFVAEPVNAG